MTEPLETRRKVLYDSFNVIPTKFVFANHMESNNTEEIEEYLNKVCFFSNFSFNN